MTASIGAHALEALARRAAEAVCVADARYDCTAKLAQTADLFAQVIASGRFLPQFLTELDDDERRNWVECCPPEEDDAPAGAGGGVCPRHAAGPRRVVPAGRARQKTPCRRRARRR